ncbi:MAG TPA: Ig-like domain repeat protein [Thermoanaerobaculia bacterium]|jgi:acetyl esterase/lipase
MRKLRLVILTVAVFSAMSSFAASRTWTGSQNGNWSNPLNWSPQGLPAPGENLSFPGNAFNVNNMNMDLAPYFSVGTMSFNAEAVLNGNPLTLTGDIGFVSSPSAISSTINVDVRLANSIAIRSAYGKAFNGAIDVNGQKLTFDPAYSTVIRGPIRGDGTIFIIGTGLTIEGNGTFYGKIDGRVNIAGSYPNASVKSARFSGAGSTGAINAGLLHPGDAPPLPSCCSEREIGILQTGSLAINPAGASENGAHNSNPKGRLQVDVNAAGPSDLLRVQGTVSLDATLAVTLLGTPINGQSFTIIDNDGTDAVSGTFTGLSEGAMFTVGSSTMWVSYRGGDGNDVVLNAGIPPPTAKTWTGVTSANWSEPSNWSPVGVPSSGEALHFPVGARLTTNNDLTGFVSGPMKFDDDYTLSGNGITLRGDLLFSATADVVFNVPFSIPADTTVNQGSSVRFNGALDVGLNNLIKFITHRTQILGSINGIGGEILGDGEGLSVRSDGAYSGRFRGRLDINGSYPKAVVDGLLGASSGTGTVDAIATLVLSPGSSVPWDGESHQQGTLDTNYLTLNDKFFVDISPTGSDRVNVVGQVNLWAKLIVTVSGTPAANQSWTLIDNAGTDAVYEHFNGLPDGSTFYVGESKFRITYKGGDGNDVVLTHLGGGPAAKIVTTTTLTQNRAVTEVHQPVTFTATVTAASGSVAGSVTFTDGATTLGSAVLQNGQAELTTKTLSQGTHSIVATYTGNDAFQASASAPLTHTVVKGKPNVVVTSSASALVHGDSASFRVDVTSSSADGRVPAGSVTLQVDGTTAGTGALASGSTTIPVASLAAGSHSITATYAGNDEFEAATGSTTQQVAKAKTSLTVDSGANPAKTDATIDVAIRVSSTDRSALGVDGPVVVRSNGQVVSEVQLSGGAASVRLGQLAAGEYEIVASFSGSDGFEPASTRFTQRIVKEDAPPKSATSTTLTQNRDVTEVHQPVTFTARVTAAGGNPTGSVTFKAGATTLGSVVLENGVAELRVKTLTEGTHEVVATYTGDETFDSSASAPLVHTAVKGSPHITLTATPTALVYGDPASFRLEVLRSEDGRLPSGRVTLRAGNNVIGTGTLVDGVATIVVPLLPAGTHSITATFEGNDEFGQATANVKTTVAKANTVVSLEAGVTAFAGVPIELTVRVDSLRGARSVDGSVTVRGSDQSATDVPVVGNVAFARVGPFERGEYELTASYSGSDNFEPASGSLRLNVTAPLLSVVSKKFEEGNGVHEVTVQIELTGASTLPIVMDYRTIAGTATATVDYDDVQGTVVFAPGQTVARVPVRIIGDMTPEPDETFTLALTNSVGARLTTQSASLVIQNDEPMHAEAVMYTYATEGGVPLQAAFYAPLEGDGPRPLILWIPGDRAYDAASTELAALRLTARGYAVTSIGYRPAGTAPFPAQIEDLGNAVRWLRENASRLNIDPNRFAAWGVGAGGHLAALLGTGMGSESSDARVQAVVVWGGIADPSTLQTDAAGCSTMNWNAATSPASVLFGCSPQLCSASSEGAAAGRHAGAGDAPMLLMHGANDCFVSARQSERLYEALRNAGVDATLRVVDGVGHDGEFWTSEAFTEVQSFLETRLTGSSRRRAARR